MASNKNSTSNLNKSTTSIPNNENWRAGLFDIVKRGAVNKLREELELHFEEFHTAIDDNQKTILHHAVAFRSRDIAKEMTEIILFQLRWDHTQQFLKHKDRRGKSAIYIAAEKRREKIVEFLLPHTVDMDQKPSKENSLTLLNTIRSKIPHAILGYYNSGVSYMNHREKISLCFGYVCDVNIGDEYETRHLEDLLKDEPGKHEFILNHPLVQSFIYLKYAQAYPFIVSSIALHVFWHVIYSYFIFTTYYTDCPWKQTAGTNVSENSGGVFCETKNLGHHPKALAFVCIFLALAFLTKEFFEFCTVPSKLRYIKRLENIGQLFASSSIIFSSWPVCEIMGGATVIYISKWQYRLASVLTFIVWALVLGQICKIRQFSYYIELFRKVIESFSKFICAFAALLFGFAFSFCILLPDSKAFGSAFIAIPKVLVMMTGELNYDDVFYGANDNVRMPFHYMTTQILFTIFTILMSMILLNLLVGLAVTDTQELKLSIHTNELSSMLEEIFLLEKFAVNVKKYTKRSWFQESLAIEKKTKQNHKSIFAIILSGSGLFFTYHCLQLMQIINRRNENEKTKSRRYATTNNGDPYTYEYSLGVNEKYPFPSKLMKDLCEIAEKNSEIENNESDASGDDSDDSDASWRLGNLFNL